MIVKGLIKTINFLDNSCTVRLPIFETAAAQGEVVVKAIISTQPGMYNGYAEGDVVFVDFENNKLSQPIVVGKLYLGAEKEESAALKGGITVSNLTVSSSATLPLNTRLTVETTGTAVEVDGGLTSYKTLADIVRALSKTEGTGTGNGTLSTEQTDKLLAEVISRITVEYLSQPSDLDPPTIDNENWDISTPDFQDGYAIWQKTVHYNHRGQILNTEIICISSLTATTTYRTRYSTKLHAGTLQAEALVVTPLVKFGTDIEVENINAKISYRWGEEGELYHYTEENQESSTKHILTLQPEELQPKNLIILIEYTENTYDTETIMYSPLNTPILNLSKETDVILYTANGLRKLGSDVTTTATLYLNGEILEADYEWELADCEGRILIDAEGESHPETIIITEVGDNITRAGSATCTATVTADGPFKGKTYFKDFTVTQTRVGEDAAAYWLVSTCTVHSGEKYDDDIIITAMKQEGTSTEKTDTTARLWWKYRDEVNWITPAEGEDSYRIKLLLPTKVRDEDILILATHNTAFNPNADGVELNTDENIYAREEIPFSPLNSPVLNLTADSGALLYDTDNSKVNEEDTVSTTAELYLNGVKIPDEKVTSYTWTLENCLTATNGDRAMGSTVTIKYLTENTATATCVAKYKGADYTKVFTIVKQGQGASVAAQTTYYALIHDTFSAGTVAAPLSSTSLEIRANLGGGEYRLLEANTEALGDMVFDTELGELVPHWTTTPPAHTAETNGWKYWTTIETIFSNGNSRFSEPIIDEAMSGVYALAQGKSTNYYSNTDPATTITLKEGDCWFDTSLEKVKVNKSTNPAVNENGSFNTAEQYIGYYWYSTVEENKYVGPLTKELINELLADSTNTGFTLGETPAYTEEKNCLKQWDGTKWIDIGGELVTNKLTANYINALDITAKKIEVLDTDNTTLFEANGIDGAHKVQIGGFDVVKSTLTTGSEEKGNLIELNSNIKQSQYEFYSITNEEYGNRLEGYENFDKTGEVIPFPKPLDLQRAQVLWRPEKGAKPHLAYGINNTAFGGKPALTTRYGLLKIVFTQNISNLKLYLKCIVAAENQFDDYLLASTLRKKDDTTSIIPLSDENWSLLQNTTVWGFDGINTSRAEAEYFNIEAGDYIYIIYRFYSGSYINNNINYGAYVYLPTDIRMTIGDNFQVLADGTVYARNLFLGGLETEPSSSGSSSDSLLGDSGISAENLFSAGNTAGQIAAVHGSFKSLEVKDTTNQTLFKADGRALDDTYAEIPDNTRVQIGGFTVTGNALSSQDATTNSKVRLGTDGLHMGVPAADTDTAPFVVNPAGHLYASQGTFEGSLTTKGAFLDNTAKFSMADQTAAEVYQLAAKANISTQGQMNSARGYFFGSGTKCGFQLAGGGTVKQNVTLSISSTQVASTANTKYTVKITSTDPTSGAIKPVAGDTTIAFSAASWDSRVSIPAGALTIKAGSSFATVTKTVANQLLFREVPLKDAATGTGGILGGGSVSTPTLVSGAKITQVTSGGSSTSYSPAQNTVTIQQDFTQDTGQLSLKCTSFEMNGAINMTGNCTAQNFKTDGKVEFKMGSNYYEPVIRLSESTSPNCFWAASVAVNSNKWQAVALPSNIQGKVQSAVVTACKAVPSGAISGTTSGDRPDYNGAFDGLDSKGFDPDDLEVGIASAMIANCIYVDYVSSDYYVWIYNGQASTTTICLMVAAKI